MGFSERRVVNKKKSRFAVVCRVEGRKAELDKQLGLRGFCRIQLLTNAECSINPACQLYFLVFHFTGRKKEISERKVTALQRNSGNVDCKRGCHGALTWAKSKFSTELANIYL
jgi:hypothetical protein